MLRALDQACAQACVAQRRPAELVVRPGPGVESGARRQRRDARCGHREACAPRRFQRVHIHRLARFGRRVRAVPAPAPAGLTHPNPVRRAHARPRVFGLVHERLQQPGGDSCGGAHSRQRPPVRPGPRRGRPGCGGVAPVPWTPILLARRRSPRCRSRDRRTRRHSDSRWSSWFGPDVHRESWLGSSSRRPRRYETGSRRLIATLASAPTACAPKNMRRFVGCAGRTGSCAKNAKFWQKPRPGSRGRPDPGGLPVHEHEPGSFSRRHDGPRARCLHERVLRVASTSTLSSGAGGCGPDGPRASDSRR